MARHQALAASEHDVAVIDLQRVLIRLQSKLLSAETEPKLLSSSYERNKTASNLEYARTLLIRLEHDSLRKPAPARKTVDTPPLSKQRALLKRLTDRMHDLERNSKDEPSIFGPEDGERIHLSGHKPTQSTSLDLNPSKDITASSHPQDPPPPQSTLRNRFEPLKPAESSKTSLFPPESPTESNATTRIQNNEVEQADLTSSLVHLATQLKQSNLKFQSSLNADDEAVRRAQDGLDKNQTGMDAAGRRMGMLKRMSEGQGLWGRLMLYAWIAALWVVAILLVFVMPKLRF